MQNHDICYILWVVFYIEEVPVSFPVITRNYLSFTRSWCERYWISIYFFPISGLNSKRRTGQILECDTSGQITYGSYPKWQLIIHYKKESHDMVAKGWRCSRYSLKMGKVPIGQAVTVRGVWMISEEINEEVSVNGISCAHELSDIWQKMAFEKMKSFSFSWKLERSKVPGYRLAVDLAVGRMKMDKINL